MEQCLLSVLAALRGIGGEIIVIDNNSTDGSKTFFQNRFPGVKFIYNTENKGFGAASNQGIQMASGEYILFLNPDTLIPEDCIVKCMAFLQSKNNRVATGVRMVDGSGRFLRESKRAFPDPLTSFYKLSGIASLFPKSPVFARYYLGHLANNENHRIDVLAGAFMMMHRSILDGIRGFDEDFFMYGEDIDLSYRIQKAGYENYYFADTTIVHFKGESTKKSSLNYVKMFYKAMTVFVGKHYKSSQGSFFNLFIQIGIFLRGAASVFARFLRWIGMPVIDVLTIFLCFWIVKKFWIAYLLPYLVYDHRFMLITFPVFTILFFLTAYYSGLYDNGYRQSRLNRAVLISTLILFTAYALVPASTRFSRGMLLSSIFMAFIAMSVIRLLLLSSGIIRRNDDDTTEKIAIAGSSEEYERVLKMFKYPNQQEEVLGRIGFEHDTEKLLGLWSDQLPLLRSGVLTRVIYCQGQLSFKEIIGALQILPDGVCAGFFAAGCSSIIDSKDRNIAGDYKTGDQKYNLDDPLKRRVKRLFDIVTSVFFLTTFPISFVIKRRPLSFLRNCIQIFFNRKTFVGYASGGESLPQLKKSVLTTTGLPANKNILPARALLKSDKIYARYYSVFMDIRFVYYGYRNLS